MFSILCPQDGYREGKKGKSSLIQRII